MNFELKKRVKNICIDIGNTQTKLGIFDNSELLETILLPELTTEFLQPILTKYEITHSIVSNVNNNLEAVAQLLQHKTNYLPFNHFTILPFTNQYQTPQTLGLDRIALAAAATNYATEQNILVISLGTCVTFEFLNRNLTYFGGAISPGLNMRLQAMNHFTAKLPLLNFIEPTHFNGNTTESCMQSGAFYGILAEVIGRIEWYKNQFGPTEILLSGGDCFLFEKHLKNALFAHPYLTLFGLNKILSHNV